MILAIKTRTLGFHNVSIAVSLLEWSPRRRRIWEHEASLVPGVCVLKFTRPLSLCPSPRSFLAGRGNVFLVSFTQGCGRPKEEAREGTSWPWATVRSLLTEFSVWLAARAMGLTTKLTDSHERRHGPRIRNDARHGAHGCSVERLVRRVHCAANLASE
jgi:hypothetical protein